MENSKVQFKIAMYKLLEAYLYIESYYSYAFSNALTLE